jgi:sulfopyruvate decarboxylase TPP-binding subunit
MGSIVEPTLKLCGVQVYRPTTTDEIPETVDAAADLAFNGDIATAVLISQRLIGRKVWVK